MTEQESLRSSAIFRRDILISPPDKDQYTTHKEKLIASVSVSEQRRRRKNWAIESLRSSFDKMEQFLGEQKLEKGIKAAISPTATQECTINICFYQQSLVT